MAYLAFRPTQTIGLLYITQYRPSGAVDNSFKTIT